MIIYQQYVDEEESQRAHLIFSLFVATVMILLCLVGLVSLHRNAVVSDGGISLDEILVFFSLSGIYIINLLNITSAWVTLGMSDVSMDSRWQAQTMIAKNTLCSVQPALQAVLITKALNRKSRKTTFKGELPRNYLSNSIDSTTCYDFIFDNSFS